MPLRVPASPKQRRFFQSISRLDNLILSMANRGTEHSAAVNAHGRFVLFDLYWPDSEDAANHPQETVLAFAPMASLTLADTGEPSVHVHVDWSAVRFAWIGRRPTTLIGTDKEIVLCRDRDKDSRVLGFHLRDWSELEHVSPWPREEFIDLDPPPAKAST